MKWGIASTGDIGAQMVYALQTLDDAEIVAVGSRTAERASVFADEHGIPTAHGSHEALCADPNVEIVYIASPMSEHRDMTIEALRAGKHVLCEKAFALDAGQAREMAGVARAERRFLMEAMWTWFLPPTIEVQRRIAEGAIGDVRTVHTDFGLALPDPAGRHRVLELGGGALLDLGIYPVSYSRLLLGPPSRVKAVGHLGPTGVDVNVGATMLHEGGRVSTFHTGLDAMTTLKATIIGTEGTIEVRAPFWTPPGYVLRRHGSEPERVDTPHDGLSHEAQHTMDRIAAGHTESDVIDLATTVAIMETLDEIRSQIGLSYPE